MQTAFEKIQDALRASPKTWLVTGVAGFIGSNLLETLLGLDQRVVGFDNLATGKQANLDDVLDAAPASRKKLFRFVKGDIRDASACLEACRGADYVLHQAALGSVPRSIENPLETHQVNVDGFVNMLMAARASKVKRFVYASSSAVYGDHPGLPKREDQTGTPLSPYALTKAINESYADLFGRVYGLSCTGLRYFNVFGRRQDPEGAYAAVIPKWIAALVRGETVEVFGDGKTTRDFCYVANAVQANLLAALSEDPRVPGRVFNVAVGKRTDLNELFERLREAIARDRAAVAVARPVYRDFRAGDIPHSLADVSLCGEVLGYRPSHDLAQGLAEAMPWYLDHLG